MKLTELFPDMPKVTIGGIEYEVKFTTRAVLQIEKDYPTPDEVKAVISSAMTGMQASDLINVLFAGLLHTKQFADKDTLIDAVEVIDFTTYADAIMVAYMHSSITQEQLEKLEVLAVGAKKKAEPETSPGNTPFIE